MDSDSLATTSRVIPGGPQAPAVAREWLAESRQRLGGSFQDAELLLSELVTNSVRHGRADAGDWIRLEMHARAAAVVVAVTDPGPGFEYVAPVEAGGNPNGSGWGLYLVATLSADWGIRK